MFTSDARAVVDAPSIKRFAGEFDQQPFHLDEASAQDTFFKKLVASGWHTTAVTMQLIIKTLTLSHGIIGTGVDELRWPRPVKPGDTLRLHCEVIDVTPSKLEPSRGTVRVRILRKASLQVGWIAPQLGLARVAHHYVPQAG